MDIEKDYYSALGVSPTADIVVIKAAYKALIKIFHPDKFKGSADEAHCKTSRLNEAYKVLSDTHKRKEYDEERANSTYKEPVNEETEQNKSVMNSLKADWDLACKYKPNLSKLYKDLNNLSEKLSFSFQVFILESKQFDIAHDIAQDMEVTYLDNYFGPNKIIMKFAKKLICDGHIQAAKELNRAVKILGASAEATVIISRIKSDFNLSPQKEEVDKENILKRKKKFHTENMVGGIFLCLIVLVFILVL
jgi:curved DNA-binding protein CbpA